MQTRAFTIRLIPARDEGDYIATTPFDTLHKEVVSATSVSEVVVKAAEIAKTNGKPCQAFITVADGGRKPKGFETSTSRLYYNLDKTSDQNDESSNPPVTLGQYAASL